MSIFKNEVGRPSNETIKKRRIFISVIAIIIVAVVCITGIKIKDTFFSDNCILSNDKNASIKTMPTKITFEKQKRRVNISNKGGKFFVPKIEPKNATESNLEWKSSNEDIASVDADGKVTPHKAGIVTITATAKTSKGKTLTATGKLYVVNLKDFKFIGHRGLSGVAPDNTLSAINKAYERGLYAVAIDPMVTEDKNNEGKVILCHDKSTIDYNGIDQTIESTYYKDIKKEYVKDALTRYENVKTESGRIIKKNVFDVNEKITIDNTGYYLNRFTTLEAAIKLINMNDKNYKTDMKIYIKLSNLAYQNETKRNEGFKKIFKVLYDAYGENIESKVVFWSARMDYIIAMNEIANNKEITNNKDVNVPIELEWDITAENPYIKKCDNIKGAIGDSLTIDQRIALLYCGTEKIIDLKKDLKAPKNEKPKVSLFVVGRTLMTKCADEPTVKEQVKSYLEKLDSNGIKYTDGTFDWIDDEDKDTVETSTDLYWKAIKTLTVAQELGYVNVRTKCIDNNFDIYSCPPSSSERKAFIKSNK